MKTVLILILVAAPCVLSSSMGLRIIGGEDAQPGQFPYQAFVSTQLGPDSIMDCGGTILNEHWILTAAHCVVRAQSTQIYVGSLWERCGDVYNVQDIIGHEYYNSVTYSNDIALLKTSKKIEMKPGRIEPINYSKDYMQGGENAIVSGWGLTDPKYPFVKNASLQYLETKTISNSQCELRNELRNVYLCTTSVTGKSSAPGDSGGPLVHDDKIIGIVSHISTITSYYKETRFEVYTRVSHYVPWIESKINA